MLFNIHILLFTIILTADHFEKLEPTVERWEKKLGIPVPEKTEDENGKIKS